MKSKINPRLLFVNTLITLTLTQALHAADGTWLGVSGNWNVAGTWSGGTIASGIDSTANFTGANITADQSISLSVDRTIGNITFTDATTSSNNLAITDNTLTLDVTTGAPIINVTQIDRALTIGSVVSGSAGLTKTGLGTLTLTNWNTYTGETIINDGTLKVTYNGSTNAGVGTLAVGSSITVNSGTTLLGSGFNALGEGFGHQNDLLTIHKGGALIIDALQVLNIPYALDVVGGTISSVDGGHPDHGSIYYGSTSGTFTSHSDGTPATISAQNFNLQGAQFNVTDGNGAVDLNVTGNLIGSQPLVKNGSGVMVLTGANTYNGGTNVTDGRLVLVNNKTGSSNFLTDSELEFSVTSGFQQLDGGTISGTGNLIKSGGGVMRLGADNSGQTIALTGASSIIDVQGGLLRNEYFSSVWDDNKAGLNVASGAVFDLWVTSTTVDELSGSGTINKGWNQDATLTIGVNDGSGTFSGVIENNRTDLGHGGDPGGTLSIVKNGTGTQTLSGANTYAGETIINDGTVELSGSGSLNNGNYAGAITLNSSSANFEKLSNGTQALSGAITGTGTVKLDNADGQFLLQNAGNDFSALNINAGRVFIQTGSGALPAAATVDLTGGTLAFDAGATYDSAITVSSGANIAARAAATLSNVTLPGTGTVIFNNDDAVTNALDISSGQTLTGTLTVQLGGSRMQPTGGELGVVTLSGVINGSGSLVVASSGNINNPNFGTGVLALSGANDYTGDTTVNSGTLAVNGTALPDGTKLTINGGKVDLTDAETVNTLFFGVVQQPAGDYSASSVPPGATITTASFSGSGTLIVGSVSGFAAWQSANGTTQTADLDHDNDGVSNGVEHFLGGIGNTTGNSNPLPGVTNNAGTLSVTWGRHPDFPGFPGNYGTSVVVETSTTLAAPWTPAVTGVGAGFVEITENNVKYTFPAGTKNFARLKVVAPAP